MRISRLVLSGAAIGTIAGTGRADLNRSHVFNPRLAAPCPIPPHGGVGQRSGAQGLDNRARSRRSARDLVAGTAARRHAELDDLCPTALRRICR